jgi:ABC-type sugar transport system ATPase subunit
VPTTTVYVTRDRLDAMTLADRIAQAGVERFRAARRASAP